jgi:hypothetical protein
MGITVYSCPDNFPQCLPQVLSAVGYQVTEAAPRSATLPGLTLRRPFGYNISDGRRVLEVTGSEEKDGRLYFMIVPKWSWNPWCVFGRRQFCDSVERALLQAGAKIVTEHELAA